MAIAFDGDSRLITLSGGTTSLSVRDLWSRWVDWLVSTDNAKYQFAFEQVGGQAVDAGAGTSIPIYVFLRNGWRVRPQPADHTLTVADGVLLVDGGGDPFVDPTGAYTVRVNYQQPVQALTVNTGGGGGGLTPEQAAQLASVASQVAAMSPKVNDVHAINYERLITDFVDGKLKLYNQAGVVTHQGNIYHDIDGVEFADGTAPILRRDSLLPVP